MVQARRVVLEVGGQDVPRGVDPEDVVGVDVRAVDVNMSNYESTLERREDSRPALRLGLNNVNGLSTEGGKRVAEARAARAFDTVRDLILRARELRDQGYEFWFEALFGRALAAESAPTGPPSPTNSEPACGRMR